MEVAENQNTTNPKTDLGIISTGCALVVVECTKHSYRRYIRS